ncbi:hypothetical protein BWQ96_06667 [Gracilariopsis chorda]|uniref:Pre-rRNA-processing protein TSR2-like n=1 Tax=Gracilariopsis chorda TaxID=448386 RepID=A0A2V3INA1_9FLOR|nr:hypothetical protein BWQ96_06667 [Gracilariopsis chorda]|eukprot:PXF43555.1 hypothetical protein BWQ96_06667 [Gracilariopsis chorda]
MQFESAQQAVSTAIRSIFDRWTALKLVIEHQMGGNPDPAIELMNIAVAMATNPSERHDEDDFIDLFYEAFNRMQADIEDGSPEEIAALVVRIRDAAARGDYTPASEASLKEQPSSQAFHRSVSGGEAVVHECEREKTPCRPPQPRQESIADDDGFTEVKSGGRHR